MRALTEKGWIDVQVGQVFAGIGFLKVEVSFEDVIKDHFNEWFQESIAPRLYPKDVKGQDNHVR